MKDTSPRMALQMEQMLQQKTAAERLLMGCSMFDFSKELVVSAVLRENPHLSAAEIKQEIFLRFYGNDFGPESRQKMIQHLGSVKQ